jgi:hypothetical protein
MARRAQHTAKPSEPAVDRLAPGGGIRVQATQLGYYDDKRRRIGDVFTIGSMKEFSHKWMVIVDPSTPERITTGQEELRRQHDAIVQAKAEGGGIGPDNPEYADGLIDE